MKSAKGVAAAVMGLAAIVAGAAFGAEAPRAFEMRPMMATSIVTGGKHVVSYFLSGDGVCRLTMMIEEAENPALRPSRIDVAVKAGSNAIYDAGNGRALSFGCNRAADAMTAVKLDNTAWRSDD